VTTYFRESLHSRGASTFSKLGGQFLGLGYCTEQNTDGIPNFVHCRLSRNGNHTLHQKSWGGPSKFLGGPDLPDPQSLCLCFTLYTDIVAELSPSSEAASEFEATNARFSLSVSVLMSAPHR